MKLDLIMLENPIIVSDEDVKESDLFTCSNQVHKCTGEYSLKVTSYVKCEKGDCSKEICQKVIAESHQIDWNGFEEEFGYFDVDKLIKSEYPVDEISFKRGFKKAQELKDKKFSLEDMRKAFEIGLRSSYDSDFENYIYSLQQTSWEVEVEMEGCSDCHLNDGYVNSPNCCRNIRPKFTEGKVKITKRL